MPCLLLRSQHYYDILEIGPSADDAEIRRAYRRLAMLYHPDKNPHSPWAAHYFLEIKEAYETLIDPLRRQHYHAQMGKWASAPPATLATLQASVAQLVQQLRQSNPYGVNKDLLLHRLSALFSERIIAQMGAEQQAATKLMQACLEASQWLGWAEFEHWNRFLRSIALPPEAAALLEAEHGRRQRQHRWQQLFPWGLGLAVASLCALLLWAASA